MRKFILWPLLGVLLLVIIISATWYRYHDVPAYPTPPVVTVKTYTVQEKVFPQYASAIGSLISRQDVTLIAKQSGQITGIYFKSGQQVKKGQLLMTIDPTREKAELAQQEANLAKAKADYERYQKLAKLKDQVVSQATVDQFRADYFAALGAVDAARKALNDTFVRAPFDGRISATQPVRGQVDQQGNSLSNITQIAVGSYVNAGQTSLVELVNSDVLYAEYDLPQRYFAQAKKGQTVDITTSAYPNKTFTAKVSYISPSISTQSHNFTVRAVYNNSRHVLVPGMEVVVHHILNAQFNALVVPAISLKPDLFGYYVFSMNAKHHVIQKRVTVGQRFGKWAEVTSGLKAGDRIIAAGQEKIHVGQTVKVAP